MASTDSRPQGEPNRRFSVHVAEEVRARAHLVEGRSFEDAALGFVQDWHLAGDAAGEAVVIVEDCQSGEHQCFRIDLGTGEAEPCG